MRINPVNSQTYNPNFEKRYVQPKTLAYTSMLTWASSFFVPFGYGIGLLGVTLFLHKIAYKMLNKGDDPVKLAENIKFKKAETIDEAKKFAQENFKIKKFKIDDLEIANWCNEGLCNISNKFKGDVFMPRKLILGNTGIFNKRAVGSYAYGDDTLTLSRKHLKPDKYSQMDLFALERTFFNSLEVSEHLNKGYLGHIKCNEFEIIYHEIGHVFNNKSKKISDSEAASIFNQVKDTLICPYNMKKDFKEFSAELFAGYMSGEKPSKEFLDLFNKINGFRLP